MISQDFLKTVISYKPETGSFTWKRRGDCGPAWNGRWPGKIAGSVKENKYGYQRLEIRINGKAYKAHHLAWLYMTGAWPDDQIDHINRDATDNRWCNLRKSTNRQNGMSRSKSINNTSGVTGVSWDKCRGMWKAHISLYGKFCHLGYYHQEDMDLAAMEVMEAREGNGFDPTHGIELARYHDGA